MQQLDFPPEVKQIDIKKTPLNEAMLELLYKHSGSYAALLNTRAQKLRGVDQKTLTEKQIKTLLLEHYSYLKRPVLLFNQEIFVGNAAATIQAAKEALNE